MEENKISNELKTVYQILSTLSVNGDAVDAMAAVRAKLRRVLSELEPKEAEQNG